MACSYLLDTPEQAAGFLAMCGHCKRFNSAIHNGVCMQELLDLLFQIGVPTNRVLKPYTIGSVGNILLGLGRVHLAECETLCQTITAHRAPFNSTLKHSWGVESTSLVDDDLLYLTAEPFLNSVRINHSHGGHGSGELIMPYQCVDKILTTFGWRPQQRWFNHALVRNIEDRERHGGVDVPVNLGTDGPNSAQVNASHNASHIPNNTQGSLHEDILYNVPPDTVPNNTSSSNVDISATAHDNLSQRTVAVDTRQPFHLYDPVLLSRRVAEEPRVAPTESELVELDENSMDLVLDPATFPNGSVGLLNRSQNAGSDTFSMVQPRPRYREALDPYARNYDESAANYNFSLENGAFLNLDAQALPEHSAQGVEAQLYNETFEIDLLSLEGDSESLTDPVQQPGPDDAQLSLDLHATDSRTPESTNGQSQHHSHAVDDPEYGHNIPWVNSRDPIESQNRISTIHFSDHQHGLESIADLTSLSSRAMSSCYVAPGSPEMDLFVLDPQSTPSVVPLSRSPHSGPTTPPQSPHLLDSFRLLSNSARRLPALVMGVDYIIPPPPTFEGGTNRSSPFHDTELSEAIEATENMASKSVDPYRSGAGLASMPVPVDETINIPIHSDKDMLWQLEKALDWDMLVYPQQSPSSMRLDSPLPTEEEELPAVVARLWKALNTPQEPLKSSNFSVHGLQDLLNNTNVALRLEGSQETPQSIFDQSHISPTQQTGSSSQGSYVTNDQGLKDRNIPSAPGKPMTWLSTRQEYSPHTSLRYAGKHTGGEDGRLGNRNDYSNHGDNNSLAALEQQDGDSAMNLGLNLGLNLEQNMAESASETSGGFVIIHEDNLIDMPYPSSISLEGPESEGPQTAGLLDNYNHMSPGTDLTEDPTVDEEQMLGGHYEIEHTTSMVSSPPSLPLLEDDAFGPVSPPVALMNTSRNLDKNQDISFSPDQNPADMFNSNPNNLNKEENDSLSQDFETRQNALFQAPTKRSISSNSQASPEPEPLRDSAKQNDLFTPLERQLRLSIDPSPFWTISENELTEYVMETMAATGHGKQVRFHELCQNAPWNRDSIVDFNLDSDLFHTLICAAGRKLVVLEQNVSDAESELIVIPKDSALSI